MRSRKWKIFKILNYVQLVYALLLFGLSVGLYIKNHVAIEVVSFIAPLGLLAAASNNYLNLFILARYFPDKSVPARLDKLNTALFIINILYSILLVVIMVIGSLEEFNHANINSFSDGKIVLLILITILVHWVYILYMQIKMFNVIKRESYSSLTRTINSIGQE